MSPDARVPFSTVPADRVSPAGEDPFLEACKNDADHLIYFLLNVGDGDTQLILLPADRQGRRRGIVVDVATTRKLLNLCRALANEEILPPLNEKGVFPLVVGTHPHRDHIGGMPEFLRSFGKQIDEYWDPGYYHSSGSYVETMVALEETGIQRTLPTSGLTRFIGNVKLTVLAPGIVLRSRFDSYGININDASLALKFEFPARRVSQATAEQEPSGNEDEKEPAATPVHNRQYHRLADPWSIILGADAQTTAWAQATLDFPQLHEQENAVLFRELKLARGADPLKAQVFKVPHHASKHGVNLELVERVKPRLALVSSVGGGGKYNFPHTLALETVREALQPSTTKQTPRLPDHELGIHYTCARVGDGRRQPLGSMAIMVSPQRRAKMRMWRFFDEPGDELKLQHARGLKLSKRSTPADQSIDLT